MKYTEANLSSENYGSDVFLKLSLIEVETDQYNPCTFGNA